jgi:integrase
MAPLLAVAEAVVASVPLASAAKIRGAVALWRNALEWFGLTSTSHLSAAIPAAILVARCCPPIDMDLPPFLQRRVLPVTAAQDIDLMRRAASMGVAGMAGALPALSDHRVLALQRAIGGRARRLTTSKRPLLFHKVEAFWSQQVSAYRKAASEKRVEATFGFVRDGFAVVLAFAAATRVSELLALCGEHLHVDADDTIILTFESVKNRRTLLSTHQPFKIALRLPLLLRAFALFNEVCGFADGVPIFHRLTGSSPDKLSRNWFAKIIKSIDPDCSPHSVRVGAATELYAAGVDLPSIMALGRWTSAAAVIYVIGCLDVTIDASARMGSAGVRLVRGDLRRQLGTSATLEPWHVTDERYTSADQWLAHCAAVDATLSDA